MHNVFVTGMGAVTAHGVSTDALKIALFQGNNVFKKSGRFCNLSFPVIAAELNQFDFEKSLVMFSNAPPALLDHVFEIGRRAPLTIQTSLVAALEAWMQAQLSERQFDNTRIGVIVAGQNTTQAYQYQTQHSLGEDTNYLSPLYALQFMDTDQVGALSNAFNIQGEGFTVGGASASGNVAIIQACRLLQQNHLDICLVVGVLADLSPLEIQGFYNIGALGGRYFCNEPAKASRPFDVAHEGFIWGQASGCLILEAFSSNALATIAGGAMSLDANRLSNPNIKGEVNVMRKSLENAGLSINDLQYINTHGSSSPLGDLTEIAAIKEFLGESVERVWLNSTKSITGHCLWSAGVIEAIATVLQMQHDFLHPNLNLDTPIDNESLFAAKKSKKIKIASALSNSFGFGGINSSIVIKA